MKDASSTPQNAKSDIESPSNNNHVKNLGDESSQKVSSLRRVLPQFLASSVNNLLIIDVGLILAFPSIVVPALTGLNRELNPNEFLQMSGVEASWLASASFIGQPIGSIFSGLIAEPFGRRRAMIFVNIPLIAAWLMLYATTSLSMTFIGIGLLGLSVGLMEAPILTYLSEISEPSIRGILMAFSGISATTGIFAVFLLGSLLSWRTVALFCALIPLMTLIAVFFIPETPIWLLGKSRDDEALRALQWLRGWVSPIIVQSEFADLQRYSTISASCSSCEKLTTKCEHPLPSIFDKIKELKRKRTLKPFMLVAFQCFVMQFCGIFAMRPYIVQILHAFGVPLDPNFATVVLGLLGIAANIVLMFTIRSFGKRNIYLYSLFATFFSCFALSFYGYKFFPSNWSSFEKHSIEEQTIVNETIGNSSYFALMMFLIMQFATSIGVSSVPNILMSELFPLKSRAFASGLAASVNYLLAFAGTKTYFDLENILSLPGVIGLYGLVGVVGFIAMYFTLPETEQRSLEDIERHFSDNNRSITDIHIKMNSSQNLAVQ